MDNIINTITLIIMSIIMGITTEWAVVGVFWGAVALYAVAVGITTMVQQRTQAKARAEQTAFTAYLQLLVRDGRQALPFQAWFDTK